MSIAIIYHSGYGHTKKQAEAVHDGVQSIKKMSELLGSC
jgi:multimeric flavodoxin WrbA